MSFLKTLLKIGAYLVGSLIVLLIIAATTVFLLSNSRMNRTHAVTAKKVAVTQSSDVLERGRHIVDTRGCRDCHGADFGGAKVIDDPAVGLFHGPNLTHGKGGLPAEYSDLDYVRAIRHGVARDGRPLLLMPSHEYTQMSDEDLGATIAYIKTAAPVDRERVPIKVGPVIRLLILLDKVKIAAEHIDHDAPRLASVRAEVTPTYGKYLAASCVGCHGENFSGGKIAGAPPDWPAAANLTRHESSRLPGWTEEQFLNVIRTQVRPDGSKVNPVMPAGFAAMTDTELKALWSYLSTLPAAPTGSRS
jgi:mono/diheme cytochrome c family protein